eukprot:3819052-Amphidinium_carterae.2
MQAKSFASKLKIWLRMIHRLFPLVACSGYLGKLRASHVPNNNFQHSGVVPMGHKSRYFESMSAIAQPAIPNSTKKRHCPSTHSRRQHHTPHLLMHQLEGNKSLLKVVGLIYSADNAACKLFREIHTGALNIT